MRTKVQFTPRMRTLLDKLAKETPQAKQRAREVALEGLLRAAQVVVSTYYNRETRRLDKAIKRVQELEAE